MTTAVILAGGLGTRLRSRVSDRPKPMASVIQSDKQETPFLAILMEYWLQQGVSRFILSVGYLSDQIIEYFGDDFQGCPIEYAIETERMGTGGALLLAMEKLSDVEHFLLLNGDTIFQVDLTELEAFAERTQAKVLLSLFESTNTKRFAETGLENDGKIRSLSMKLSERDTKTASAFAVNGGVYWFRNKIGLSVSNDQYPLSLETDMFPVWQQQGVAIYGKVFKQPFIDMGLPEDYDRLGDFLQNLND